MTMTVFTSSYTQGGYIWAGSAGDGFFVAPGVAVTDTSAAVNNVEDYIAFIDTEGSSTAQIDGSVTAAGAPLILGNGYSGSGTANIQIGSGGSVNGDNATYAAIQIHQNLSHGREGELITNAGVIDGAGQAISSNAYGSITNNGAIYAGSDAVDNFDGVSTDTVSLFNHGTISGGSYGVIDTGGHVAVIYNSGAIDGALMRSSRTPPPPKRSPITPPGR